MSDADTFNDNFPGPCKPGSENAPSTDGDYFN